MNNKCSPASVCVTGKKPQRLNEAPLVEGSKVVRAFTDSHFVGGGGGVPRNLMLSSNLLKSKIPIL